MRPDRQAIQLFIRSSVNGQYRSGEWAKVTDVCWFNERACFQVEFIDGATDFWAIEDRAANYDFKGPWRAV